MSESRRRIATLLAADVSDESRSQDAAAFGDEKAVTLRRDIFLSLVAEHDGHCFHSADETSIAEFSSAVNAVHCAVAIQRAMLEKNDPLPPDERALLRIGLNVGDVSEKNGSLYGDGVDIAVGLQKMAVPGGICLAGTVYEHAKQRMRVGVEFAGEKRIRHIPEPVAIYQVVEPGVEKGYISLWEELKRRNVFRVGVAYTVVAWLLIQVADVVLPTFDSPRWIMQGFISLVILGFPLAVVLAWVYELTPRGLKRSDDILRQSSMRWLTGRRLDGAIITLLVVAVVFLIYDNYLSTTLDGVDVSELESIAVLAFENRSTDPEDEYFADGLADELLSVLGRIQELKVASRMSSFYFKGKDVDIGTIASKLMVNNILSGSVRREGDRIRVTTLLDDAKTGSLLWSKTYDRQFDDILDIQSDIARSVVSAIVPVLSRESQMQIVAQPTESTEAYDYYLRGRDYLRRPAEITTLASAADLFGRSIDLDPEFAQAHAGLCETHLARYEFARSPESFEKAEVECQLALTLDDGLWEVYVALGNLYRISGQYEQAILNLQNAIETQPNAVSSYLALAQTYADQNRLKEAESTFRQAERVESGYWGVHRAFGNFLYDQSRYDEAIKRHLKVTELAPDSGIGYDNLGNAYLALGDLEQAEQAFNASPLPSRWTYANRGLVYYYRHQYLKAIEDQKQAIDLAPDVHSAWGHLGDAYRFVEGEDKNANDAYDTAIKLAEQQLAINPTDWGSVGRLGLYYAHTGQLIQAREQLARLLELTTDSTAYYFATLLSLEFGELDHAQEYFQRTVEGGWSRSLLAGDPDLAALRGYAAYDTLQSTAQD
ncbi:MAG: tetratricopeptide repeat protein [Gammaproteobacteria bacterium]|nr:tetratricopeptide repeat protein [Gammaproteobacteria bacterium]